MKNLITFPVRFLGFAVWFAGMIVVSSWTVLADILTPGLNNTPRVVRMPLDSRRDFHIATIGALISLTPGTLTLGVAEDLEGEKTPALLVHTMYHKDAEQALAELHDMEKRMLNALRIGVGP